MLPLVPFFPFFPLKPESPAPSLSKIESFFGPRNCFQSIFLNLSTGSKLLIKWTLQCSHSGLVSTTSSILKSFGHGFSNRLIHSLLQFQNLLQVSDNENKMPICFNVRGDACGRGNHRRFVGCNSACNSQKRSVSQEAVF